MSRRAIPLLWILAGEALVFAVTVSDLRATPSDPGPGLRSFWIGQVIVIGGLMLTAIASRLLQGGGVLGSLFQCAGLVGFLSFCWWALHGPDAGFDGTPWLAVAIGSVVVQAVTALVILGRGGDG
ncbi:hypothetical protein ASE01_09935 [Nocardioides sp. Root190]|uniref:hypothetical protein n=1 Tax=Nocardioides sp. Root190 TaxID=1736488 RepID=UPI0006FAF3D5|nr:hypothetical protein [Nocardioides sp. Root190]KRB77069.1 hypothetical protein ASE01_09935 [Nocardioides sp. Root190]